MSFNLNSFLTTFCLIICCGAAIILVRMLVSNTLLQEKFFASLGQCRSELELSSKRLETIAVILERRHTTEIQERKQPDPFILDVVKKFESLSNLVNDKLDKLVFSPTITTKKDGPSDDVIKEIVMLQAHLESLSKELRRNNYITTQDNSELEAMKKRIESYQNMVMKSRSEAKEYETIIADLRFENGKLRSSKDVSSESDILRLKEEISEIKKQKQSLEAKLASVNDEMKRNNIEKQFIEERFVEIS